MPDTSRAMELVRAHCDIVERLKDVPPAASLRGIFFRNLQTQMDRAGRGEVYRSYFPGDRHATLPYYPLGDYLLRLAVAGAVVESPEGVQRGIFTLSRTYPTMVAESLLGRALLRLLSRDPVRLSEQGLAARRQTTNYGHWEIARPGPTELEMRYEDEFQWIDSAMAGAATGTFEVCGVPARVETRLRGRYSGSTVIRW